MKLFLPRGSVMTDQEKTEWIDFCNKATGKFNKGSNPQPILFNSEFYLKNKESFVFDKYITDMWKEHYEKAEKLYLQGDQKFLTDDLIRYAFFYSGGGIWQKKQIPYLQSKRSESELKSLLVEDHIFWPTITDEHYKSSECLIHHLTHFTCFEEITGAKISDMKNIIEFGGGYGGMCRLARRLTNNKSTHVIIDLPIFSFIQYNYLQNIFGQDSVNMMCNNDSSIKEGKVNLIPISNKIAIDKLSSINPDLFIATWSLSEANQNTVDLITGLNYFSSKYLLMAYRHYDGYINERQPCSDKLITSSEYEVLKKGNTFYCLDNEQHYYFCKHI